MIIIINPRYSPLVTVGLAICHADWCRQCRCSTGLPQSGQHNQSKVLPLQVWPACCLRWVSAPDRRKSHTCLPPEIQSRWIFPSFPDSSAQEPGHDAIVTLLPSNLDSEMVDFLVQSLHPPCCCCTSWHYQAEAPPGNLGGCLENHLSQRSQQHCCSTWLGVYILEVFSGEKFNEKKGDVNNFPQREAWF